MKLSRYRDKNSTWVQGVKSFKRCLTHPTASNFVQDAVQSWPKKCVLGCVISQLRQQAESRNTHFTLQIMTFWINVVSATVSYGPEITFPMKFRPGTTKICAQNTWDNLRGKQMLLVAQPTCRTNVFGQLCMIQGHNKVIHYSTYGWSANTSAIWCLSCAKIATGIPRAGHLI